MKLKKQIKKLTEAEIDGFSLMVYNEFRNELNSRKNWDLSQQHNVLCLMEFIVENFTNKFLSLIHVKSQKHIKLIQNALEYDQQKFRKIWTLKLTLCLYTEFCKVQKKDVQLDEMKNTAIVMKSTKHFFQKALLLDLI